MRNHYRKGRLLKVPSRCPPPRKLPPIEDCYYGTVAGSTYSVATCILPSPEQLERSWRWNNNVSTGNYMSGECCRETAQGSEAPKATEILPSRNWWLERNWARFGNDYNE